MSGVRVTPGSFPELFHGPIGGTRNYGRPSAESIRHYRDLLGGDELSEFDATPAGPDALDQPAELSVDCPEWADHELGAITRGLLAGKSVARIARAIGVSPQLAALHQLVREIRSLGDATAIRQRGPRRRGMPAEDEATARVMRHDQHLSIAEIAKRLGTTEGALSWCLANPRDA